MLERALPRDVAIIRVRKNRANNFLRVAALSKNPRAFRGMLLVGCVRFVGPALVIKIMEQRSDTPNLFVRAGLPRVGAHARFHGQHVLAQAFRLRVFAQEFPGVFACGHAALRIKNDKFSKPR